MATSKPELNCAPERLDRVVFTTKFSYAIGGTTEILGHWVYGNLANHVFVTYFGLTPTWVNIALGIARLIGAFTDPLVGWVSDNTGSRWGRRRPFILAGSTICGLALPCLFMVPGSFDHQHIFWFMIVSSTLYAPILSVYDMSYQSLGAELTPSYHERTSVMAWKAYAQKISGMIAGAGFSFATLAIFANPLTGEPDVARSATLFAALCGVIMLASGLLNFSFVRERYYGKVRVQAKVAFQTGFAETLRCRPYLILLGLTSIYAIPTSLSGLLGYYATTYYVCPHDLHQAANISTWSGVVYAVIGIGGVPIAARLSRRFGNKRALSHALLASLLTFASSWWLFTPKVHWLSVLQRFCSHGAVGFAAIHVRRHHRFRRTQKQSASRRDFHVGVYLGTQGWNGASYLHRRTTTGQSNRFQCEVRRSSIRDHALVDPRALRWHSRSRTDRRTRHVPVFSAYS